MAPLEVTDDYYMILEVDQDATSAAIVASYRKLALKRHPDRSKKHNATADFQLLQEAYETLNDPAKRLAYDIIYPSIKYTPLPRPSAASNPQSGPLDEASQIILLQKSKQDRSERWHNKKIFESSVFELQSAIWNLEQGINNLVIFAAAEAAIEHERTAGQHGCCHHFIEKWKKERRLELKRTELKKEESLLAKAKREVHDADMDDDRKINALRNTILAREARERSERDRVERERIAKLWQQERERQEKLAREEAEALRGRQAEERRRKQEEDRKWQQWSSQRA